MYQSRSHVFLALPRTASRAVARWLQAVHGGTGVGDHHDIADLINADDSRQIFTVIRHPYDRMASLYRFLTHAAGQQGRPFADWATEFRERLWLSAPPWAPQDVLIALAPRIDVILRFEDLPDALGTLDCTAAGQASQLEHVGDGLERLDWRSVITTARDINEAGELISPNEIAMGRYTV